MWAKSTRNSNISSLLSAFVHFIVCYGYALHPRASLWYVFSDTTFVVVVVSFFPSFCSILIYLFGFDAVWLVYCVLLPTTLCYSRSHTHIFRWRCPNFCFQSVIHITLSNIVWGSRKFSMWVACFRFYSLHLPKHYLLIISLFRHLWDTFLFDCAKQMENLFR